MDDEDDNFFEQFSDGNASGSAKFMSQKTFAQLVDHLWPPREWFYSFIYLFHHLHLIKQCK